MEKIDQNLNSIIIGGRLRLDPFHMVYYTSVYPTNV